MNLERLPKLHFLVKNKSSFDSENYMIKYFKTFFYPDELIYSYNHSKEVVLSKIDERLNRKVSLFLDNDFKGQFVSGDSFQIEIASAWGTNGIRYGSRLTGQVMDAENGKSRIITKAKPSIAFYLLFFIAIIIGMVYLHKFILSGDMNFLFWSLSLLILGPALSIGFSNIAIFAIRERYNMNIDKELRTM